MLYQQGKSRHQRTSVSRLNRSQPTSPRLTADYASVRDPEWKRVESHDLEELTRLKALYQGFGYRELARIIHYTCNERIDDKTVKKLWQQSPVPIQGELPLGTYHRQADRSDARRQVIKLYAQGWSKGSISAFLQVSRPTVACRTGILRPMVPRLHFVAAAWLCFVAGGCAALNVQKPTAAAKNRQHIVPLPIGRRGESQKGRFL